MAYEYNKNSTCTKKFIPFDRTHTNRVPAGQTKLHSYMEFAFWRSLGEVFFASLGLSMFYTGENHEKKLLSLSYQNI